MVIIHKHVLPSGGFFSHHIYVFSPFYLWNLHIVVRGLPSIITGLPLPLVADALDEVLMEVTDVEVPHLQIISGVLKGSSYIWCRFFTFSPNKTKLQCVINNQWYGCY